MRMLVVFVLLVVGLGGLALGVAQSRSAQAQQPSEIAIDLVPGFNEFVYAGPSAAVGDALASIDGLYAAVFHWSSAEQVWRTYRPGQPAFLSDLETLEPDHAYWIVVSQRVRLSMVADPPPCESPAADPFVQSYDGMWLVLAEQLDLLSDMLDDLEADPTLADGETVDSAMFIGGVLAVANQIISSSSFLAALVAPADLEALQALVQLQAEDAGLVGLELLAALLIGDPEDYLAPRATIDDIHARHQAFGEAVAMWCA